MFNRDFLLGVAFASLAIMASCASVTFPYKYYVLDAESYQGSLMGDIAAHDLPMSVCAPDEVSKGKCIVMVTSDYLNLKSDYLKKSQDLIDCQKSSVASMPSSQESVNGSDTSPH